VSRLSRLSRRRLLVGGTAASASVLLLGASADMPQRIVSAGASVTEILFALGVGDHVVGSDTSSRFPAASQALPNIGYHRALAAEGILSLRPDVFVHTDQAGPPQVLQQLKAAGLAMHQVPSTPSVDGLYAKIRAVAKAVHLVDNGEALVARVQHQMQALQPLANDKAKTRVGFIYARGNGAMMLSGTNTAAHGILTLAGVQNAMTSYEGYKPLSAEGMVVAAPDVLLIPQRALGPVKGVDGVLRAPGVSLTPAGKTKRVVAVDDVLLLGFGPRLPLAIQTVRDLVR